MHSLKKIKIITHFLTQWLPRNEFLSRSRQIFLGIQKVSREVGTIVNSLALC